MLTISGGTLKFKRVFFISLILLITQVNAETIFEDVATRLKKSIKKVQFDNGLNSS
jgi:hypothetical protein